MVRAILFDSDGLMVDTERLFFEATRSAFASVGASLPAALWARCYLGEGLRSRGIARMLNIRESLIEAVIASRDDLFWRKVDEGVPVFYGVHQTLCNLAPFFRLAVVTGASRSHFERVHTSTGLRGFFQTVITSDDYESPKPHPQAYLTAVDALRLSPHECVAVEDSPRGAAAAVAAGLRCYIVPTPLTDMELCPASCIMVECATQLAERIRADIV